MLINAFALLRIIKSMSYHTADSRYFFYICNVLILFNMKYKPFRCLYNSCGYPNRQCLNCDANKDLHDLRIFLSNPYGLYQALRGFDPFVKLGANLK